MKRVSGMIEKEYYQDFTVLKMELFLQLMVYYLEYHGRFV